MKSTATRFKWSLRSIRGHNAHGFAQGISIGAGSPIRALRRSTVPVERSEVPLSDRRRVPGSRLIIESVRRKLNKTARGLMNAL